MTLIKFTITVHARGGGLAQFLYLKNSKQFPLSIGESPSEKRLRQQESKLYDGEFVEIMGLIIKNLG